MHPSMLGDALVIDFREAVLPMIAKPRMISELLAGLPEVDDDGQPNQSPESHESYLDCGTFDPLETARMAGKMLEEDIRSTSDPKATTPRTEAPMMPEYNGIGLKPGLKLAWEKFKFHFLMSNTANSLGRGLLQLGGNPILVAKISARDACVANLQATRTVLASILYRRRHQGKLPNKLSDLVPEFLSSVPQDFSTGRAMKYDKASGMLSWTPIEKSFDNEAIASFVDLSTSTITLPKGPS